MTTPERRCPHCDSVPTSKWVWGGEGTIWEDWWACPCGGSGPADQLTDYDNEDEPKEQT